MSTEKQTISWAQIKGSKANLDGTEAKHVINGPLYIVLEGKVYDVADFIDEHPGGFMPIHSQIGRDATDAFEAFHPMSAYDMLGNYYVGDLEKDADEKIAETPTISSGFLREIRELRQEFNNKGYFDANLGYYAFKISVLYSHLAISLLVLSLPLNAITVTISGLFCALFFQQSGWLAHDFLHHQVFKNRSLNNLVGYLLGNVGQGFSVSWWKSKHNTHHAAPNAKDIDPDIDTLPFLALDESVIRENKDQNNFVIKNQLFFYFPLLCFARLSWAIQSALYVSPSTKHKIHNRTFEQITISLHWVWYLGVAAWIALRADGSLLSALAWILVGQAATGVMLGSVFSLNHNAMPLFTDSEFARLDFYSAQILSGRNVISTVMTDWFTGGLNYQIEHHLFPLLPRHNFHLIQPQVSALCKQYGIDYHSTTFWAGNVEVLTKLASVMRAAREIKTE